jgi:hypothetical protein
MRQIFGRLTDDKIRKRDCMVYRNSVQASGRGGLGEEKKERMSDK